MYVRPASAAALSLILLLAAPAFAQVQLDHDTAEKLTALGIDTSLVIDEDDVGYINQILASDSDDATKTTEIMELLDRAAVSYQVVLTKADQLKPAEIEASQGGVTAVIRRHPAAHPEVLVTSSATGAGLPALRAEIAGLLA